MKNRITTPRGLDLLYQAALLMACALVMGCPTPPQREARLPGPFTQIERVEIGGEGGIVLAREGDVWSLERTPFLVDARRAEALERAFHVRWEPVELRAIEHTGEVLHVVGDRAVEIRIVPIGDQPVTYYQGRAENEGAASWILARHAVEAALIRGAPRLSADPITWRSDEVMGIDAALVLEVRLEPGPHAVRRDGGWSSDTQLDPYRVEQLVRRLTALDAEPIPATPAPDSSHRHFELITESTTHVLALHETEQGVVLSVDGQLAFALSESDAQYLELAHRTLGQTERLALVPERITRMRLVDTGERLAFAQTDDGWIGDDSSVPAENPGAPESSDPPENLDRWVRAVTRLDAYYDAPELRVAFTLPRRSVTLETEERTIRVDFVWRDGENVYARIDGGLPFRTERSAERIFRTPLLSEHSETTP
jgi:hypothetical protein